MSSQVISHLYLGRVALTYHFCFFQQGVPGAQGQSGAPGDRVSLHITSPSLLYTFIVSLFPRNS